MYLTRLQITNFRNIEQLSLSPARSTNLISGPNGAGKTSILEAIFCCCTSKSFRGASDDQLRRHGADICRLEMAGEIDDDEVLIELAWGDKEKKQLKINGVKQRKLSELFNYFHAVNFIPEDIEIVTGAPAVRRRMIDIYLSQCDRNYLSRLIEYHHVLAQRNALLKEFGIDEENNGSIATLEVWDNQLAAVGATIIRERLRMLEETAEIVAESYHMIEGGTTPLRWEYDSTVKAHDDIESAFCERLKKSRKKDFYLGATSVGPHRDDITITLNDLSTRGIASQGEAKSIALAVKLAVFSYLREKLGSPPILLFDELSSDLDRARYDAMLALLPDLGQVFLTSARPEELGKGVSIAAEITIEGGKLISQSSIGDQLGQ